MLDHTPRNSLWTILSEESLLIKKIKNFLVESICLNIAYKDNSEFICHPWRLLDLTRALLVLVKIQESSLSAQKPWSVSWKSQIGNLNLWRFWSSLLNNGLGSLDLMNKFTPQTLGSLIIVNHEMGCFSGFYQVLGDLRCMVIDLELWNVLTDSVPGQAKIKGRDYNFHR